VSIIKDTLSNVNQRIADRVRQLRAAQRLSLDALSGKSGVSRSMISVVERGASSPTAVILERLAAGLGVTMASLFELTNNAGSTANQPVSRRDDQPEWKDPASGYIRRNLSPSDVRQPMQLVEITFPPRARVPFETAVRDVRIYQQILILEGAMDVTLGIERHRLERGDCLAMQLDAPTVFYNPGRKAARYLVVSVIENASRR